MTDTCVLRRLSNTLIACHSEQNGVRRRIYFQLIDSYQTTLLKYLGLKDILNDAIKKLPDVQRSVILLRDYEGYSYEEIGKMTDLSESQVKVYIYRARVFLKEYIGSLENVI